MISKPPLANQMALMSTSGCTLRVNDMCTAPNAISSHATTMSIVLKFPSGAYAVSQLQTRYSIVGNGLSHYLMLLTRLQEAILSDYLLQSIREFGQWASIRSQLFLRCCRGEYTAICEDVKDHLTWARNRICC